MNVREISSNPNLQLVINAVDLKELVVSWMEEHKESLKPKEEYLTPEDVCFLYKVSKVTLWRNGKNGLWPKPIKVGRKSLYRKSDMDGVFMPVET